jgi:hypothetical protein
VIAVYIFVAQVIQESSSLTYQLEQTPLGVEIMFTDGHVPGQLGNPLSEDSHLNFSRAGVPFMDLVLLYNAGFLGFNQFNPPELSLVPYFEFIINQKIIPYI